MKTQERKLFLQRLGKWLLSLRKSRGLGQDALTEQAGLARGTISRIENGAADPRVTTLVRISRVLKVSLAKIIQPKKKAA